MNILNELSPLVEIVLTSPTNTLTQSMVSTKNAIYIIKDVFNLNATEDGIKIPENCTLYFKGGALTNGTIVGNGTFIKAMNYHIFDNSPESLLKLSGTFSNDSFSAHWFGAKGDGATDDAPAINHALTNSCLCPIVLDKLNYFISSTIHLDIQGLNLKCRGTISTDSDIKMIEITSQNNKVDINELKYNYSGSGAGDYSQFKATAICLSNNVFHNTINVDFINYVRNGFLLAPRLLPNQEVAGCQYNKFTFQIINAKYCIRMDMISSCNYGKGLWVNENQFTGGRCIGLFGVYVDRVPSPRVGIFDPVNGNVFNCIGFEKIRTPIYMYRSTLNSFNDIRLDGDENTEYYIDLLNCNNITFNTKSYVEYTKIKAKNSCQITLSRLFSDPGKMMGYDRMALSTNIFPMLSEKSTSVKDFQYIHRSESPLNMLKELKFDSSKNMKELINFNELFNTIKTEVNENGVIKTFDTLVFSNLCEITTSGDVNLIIDFKDSIYKLRPDMTIRYNHYGNSKIYFYTDYQLGEKEIAFLDKSGTYKFTTDRDYNIHIVKIGVEEI